MDARQKFIGQLALLVDGYKRAEHCDAWDRFETVLAVAIDKAWEANFRAIDNPWPDVTKATQETLNVLTGIGDMLQELRSQMPA
jgi:hypothetical protein